MANHIRAVIAPTFGDIHYSNCIKNGLLPVRLSAANCNHIRIQLHESPGATIAIDLEEQVVSGPNQKSYNFDIDSLDKIRLLNGLDDISMTLEHQTAIEAFEQDYRKNNRWIF
jgi:3-isopropylmalate/(R)-2-methylmalate dehydratase small subunit